MADTPISKPSTRKSSGPASRQTSPDKGSQDIQVICFSVGGTVYGMDITGVQEIIRARKPVDGQTDPDTVGVVTHRGQVIPLIDLRVRLGLPRRRIDDQTRIIVTERADGRAGILVDAVTEVLRFEPSSLQPPPDQVTPYQEMVMGRYRTDDTDVAILDCARILSP